MRWSKISNTHKRTSGWATYDLYIAPGVKGVHKKTYILVVSDSSGSALLRREFSSEYDAQQFCFWLNQGTSQFLNPTDGGLMIADQLTVTTPEEEEVHDAVSWNPLVPMPGDWVAVRKDQYKKYQNSSSEYDDLISQLRSIVDHWERPPVSETEFPASEYAALLRKQIGELR